MVRQPLPIDSLLPAVLAKLRDSSNLIIEAAPGAGKTTRVPPALLDAGVLEGGEILVADTVRGLCSGKGFLFADRGEFVAKGFEEPVRVYEVSWRG